MMFLSATEATELSIDIDVDAIKSYFENFDPSALLPDIDTLVGKVQAVCSVAMLLAPLVMVVMGLAYLFFAPREANYYFGYRTAFGMGSVSAWRRTQRTAGLVFTLLGAGLTFAMLLMCTALSGREAMDMVWLAAKCVLWQAALALLAKLFINVYTVYSFDYNGRRRRKPRKRRAQ